MIGGVVIILGRYNMKRELLNVYTINEILLYLKLTKKKFFQEKN